MLKINALFVALALPFILLSQSVDTLLSVSIADVNVCGAGYTSLTAEALYSTSDDLIFEWYQSESYLSRELLGELQGSAGSSQLLTPFLIADQRFSVRVREEREDTTVYGPFQSATVFVENQASIVQSEAIELCGEAYLETETDMDDIASYQWQVRVPNEFGESSFVDISSTSGTSHTLTTSETGFYRVVVTDDLGCQGISKDMEVTNDRLITLPSAVSHCYDSTVFGSDSVTLSNPYGRSFTEYLWEFSTDSINFIEDSTTQNIVVSKPTSQAFDTAYYRATVTEQNCTYDTIISVKWNPDPNGSFSHLDGSIAQSDFFYCGTDDESTRTLVFDDPQDYLAVSWYSASYSKTLDLSFIKNLSGEFNEGKAYFLSTTKFNFLGSGDTLVLGQNDSIPFAVDGGLVTIEVTDLRTGCSRVGSNAVFADAPFPYPLYGGSLAYDYPVTINGMLDYQPLCVGQVVSFYSYDQSVDAYTWWKYDEANDNLVEVGSADELILEAEHSIAGTYYLQVTKNGCTGFSKPFDIQVFDNPTISLANVDQDTIETCPGTAAVYLDSKGSDDITRYYWWYSEDGSSYSILADSNTRFYFASKTGHYKVEGLNTFCSAESESVFISIPATEPIEINGGTQFCAGDQIDLSFTHEGISPVYDWYYAYEDTSQASSNGLTAIATVDEPSISFSTNDIDSAYTDVLPLYFYVSIEDEGCRGTLDSAFQVTVAPLPSIEIVLADDPTSEEVFFCTDETINEALQINNVSTGAIENLSYFWMRYNPVTNTYDTLQDATGLTYTAEEAGRYSAVALTSDSVCYSVAPSVNVLTLPTEVEGDSVQCSASEMVISARQGLIPDMDSYDFTWYYSADGGSFNVLPGAESDTLVIEQEDELFGAGYFYFEVSREACVQLSDTLQVQLFESPTVQIVSQTDDELLTCASATEVLLLAEASESVETYKWYYSEDGLAFVDANGTNDAHFYFADTAGFYQVVVETEKCASASNPIEITFPSEDEDVEESVIVLEGATSYCEGEEIQISCLYEDAAISYAWYYFQNDDSTNLQALTSHDESLLSISTAEFATGIEDTLKLTFYVQVEEEGCVAGVNKEPFEVYIKPVPAVELRFVEHPEDDLVLFCEEGGINVELKVENRSENVGADGYTYMWRRYNVASQRYDTLLAASSDAYRVTETGRYQAVVSWPDVECATITNELDVLMLPTMIEQESTGICANEAIMLSVAQENIPDLSVFEYQWFYSVTGSAYSALENDTLSMLSIPVDSEKYRSGYYYFQSSYDGCLQSSNTVEMNISPPLEVEIAGGVEEVQLCSGALDVLLVAEVNDSDARFTWFYSEDNITFEAASGSNSSHFYRASARGYYRVQVENTHCLAADTLVVMTSDAPVESEELYLSGASEYCQGDEVVIDASYVGAEANYYWYVAAQDIDLATEPVTLHSIDTTQSAQLVISTDTLVSYLPGATELFFYAQIQQNGCFVGSTPDAFQVDLKPVPDVVLSFRGRSGSEVFFCDADEVNVEMEITNESGGLDAADLQYLWRKYNTLNDAYDTLAAATSAVFRATDPGRYQAIASLPDGCHAVSNTVDILTPPHGYIVDKTAYCGDDPIMIEAVASAVPSLDPFAFSWYFSSDGATYEQLVGEEQAQLRIETSDERYRSGYYLFQSQYGDCMQSSDTVVLAVSESIVVSIVNGEGSLDACSNISDVMLVGEVSAAAMSYQWYYSLNEEDYAPAEGFSNHMAYRAGVSGYYKLMAFAESCRFESEAILVEIPQGAGDDFEMLLDGPISYCEGEEVVISNNYISADANYFWYYSKADINTGEPVTSFSQLGITDLPEISTATYALASSITEPVVLYIYSQVVENECVVGNTQEPFIITIHPKPAIELIFSDSGVSSQRFVCDDGAFSQPVEVVSLSGNLPEDAWYLWNRWNPNTESYDTLQGVAGDQYLISEPGRYRVTAQYAGGRCFSVSNDLDALMLPTGILGGTDYCFGADIELQVSQNFLPNLDLFSFQWYRRTNGGDVELLSGKTDAMLVIAPDDPYYEPAAFFYTATFDGCETRSNDQPLEEKVNLTSILSVASPQEKGIPFEAAITFGEDDPVARVEWMPEDFISYAEDYKAIFNFPTVFSADSVFILATVINENDCEVTHEQWVHFAESSSMTYSKFISPNGDGLNDYFEIVGLDQAATNQLIVVDSWGNRLFVQSGYYNAMQESQALINSLGNEGTYYFLFTEEGRTLKGSFYLKK